MQALTFQTLVEWTSNFHRNLEKRLKEGIPNQKDGRARWLLEYVAKHEREMATTVDSFKDQADLKALHTWHYEHLTETLPPSDDRPLPFGSMSFDEISAVIFDVHGQVIENFKTLSANAAIPEARGLMIQMLEFEEHEAQRLAKQIRSSAEL
jgi:hypothetical protein